MIGSMTMPTPRRRAAVLAATVAAVTMAASSFASSALARPVAGESLSWSRPALVDRLEPYSYDDHIYQVQCPSSQLCVAVDEVGNLLTSTSPTSGSWKIVSGQSVGNLMGDLLSCPSIHLCVVGGATDDVLVSNRPAGGAQTWKTIKLSGYQPIQTVACAGTRLCMAVDDSGNMLSSTDPEGGSAAWHEQSAVFPNGTPEVISCPSASFCAGSEQGPPGEGTVYTSENPTGGASAWHSQLIDHSRYSIGGISCPSTDLCVAFDGRNVISSTTPATGPWKSVRANGTGGGDVNGIWCDSPTRCVTSDLSGNVFVSSNPAGGSGAWTRTNVGDRGLSSVSCPASALCVASTFRGQMLTTSDPGAGQWRVAFEDGFNKLTGVSCPGAHLCVAVDDAGDVLSSSNPTAGARAWRTHRVDPTGDGSVDGNIQDGLVSISCPATTVCVALDATGRLLNSSHPTRGRSAWRLVRLKQILTSVDCPTVRRCFAVDVAGNVWTSARPLGGAHAWSRRAIVGDSLTGIGCFGVRLCVAGDGSGSLLASIHPTHGRQAWHKKSAVGYAGKEEAYWTISCPTQAVRRLGHLGRVRIHRSDRRAVEVPARDGLRLLRLCGRLTGQLRLGAALLLLREPGGPVHLSRPGRRPECVALVDHRSGDGYRRRRLHTGQPHVRCGGQHGPCPDRRLRVGCGAMGVTANQDISG